MTTGNDAEERRPLDAAANEAYRSEGSDAGMDAMIADALMLSSASASASSASSSKTPSRSPMFSDEEYEEYLPEAVEESATIFGLSQSASPVSSEESLVVSPRVETASTPPPERTEPLFAFARGAVRAAWNRNDDARFDGEATPMEPNDDGGGGGGGTRGNHTAGLRDKNHLGGNLAL